MLILEMNGVAGEKTHFTKKDMNFKAIMGSVCMVFEWRTKHDGILGWGCTVSGICF
jgi:hypothetical protein